jgi:hypothetical protein
MNSSVITEKFDKRVQSVLAIFKEIDKAMMDLTPGSMTETITIQRGIVALEREIEVIYFRLLFLNLKDQVYNLEIWEREINLRMREVSMQAKNMALIIDNQMVMHDMYRAI